MPGIDAATQAAIERRAQELADQAPELTADQAVMLLGVLRRYPAQPDAAEGGAP